MVVTIIVLLILAGGAITLTIGQNGIFARAQNAVNINEQAAENEQSALEGLQVGQYVEYVPDTYVNPTDSSSNYTLSTDVSGYSSEQQIAQLKDLKWRIMSINADGTVEIISDNTYDSGTRIYLQEATGYNNGVYILDDIAKKQYSNRSLNATARSINLEDIEKRMNSTGIAARDAYTANGVQYGGTKTYTGSYSYYPNIYAEENGSGINTEEVKTNGIGVSEEGSSNFEVPSTETPAYRQASENGLTVTQNYYYMAKSKMSAYFDDTNFHQLIFNTNSYYWLASRFANCNSTSAGFGLLRVNSSILGGNNLFTSNNFTNNSRSGLRAVVSLGSGVEFTDGDGSEGNPYKLSL